MKKEIHPLGEYEEGKVNPGQFLEFEPQKVQAFGVVISSRLGRVREMLEILTILVAMSGRDRETINAIQSIEYDSSNDYRNIRLREDREPSDVKEFCDRLGGLYQKFGAGFYRMQGKWLLGFELRYGVTVRIETKSGVFEYKALDQHQSGHDDEDPLDKILADNPEDEK
jgi:hypothetical protein